MILMRVSFLQNIMTSDCVPCKKNLYFTCDTCHPRTSARKSVRQSTSEHTRKTNLRLQERQDAPRRRRGAHRDQPLTQEELLAEAKITAEINIRSLGESRVGLKWFLFHLYSLILY